MKILKNKYIVILASILMLLISACSIDEDSEAVFTDDELPKIFFTNWQTTQTISSGEVLIHTPVVSPNDGAEYKWTIDSVVISEERELEYTVTETIGTYTLKFEVIRNGISTSRTAQLTVN